MKIKNGYYIVEHAFKYYSLRYFKSIYVEKGFKSDGASGAIDICSKGWLVHDKICETWEWDDGTPISNFQASMVLHDILKEEGRWFRCYTWFLATFLFGGTYRFFKRFSKTA